MSLSSFLFFPFYLHILFLLPSIQVLVYELRVFCVWALLILPSWSVWLQPAPVCMMFSGFALSVGQSMSSVIISHRCQPICPSLFVLHVSPSQTVMWWLVAFSSFCYPVTKCHPLSFYFRFHALCLHALVCTLTTFISQDS